MANIAVINTGGTISCIGDPLTPMKVDDFAIASNKFFADIFTQPGNPSVTFLDSTETIAFPESDNGTLDSTNLQPSDWCLIAKTILNRYDDYDGFVVLHGTDTMAFTGTALPFLLNYFDTDGNDIARLDKPVIITGSQVPMYYTAVDYPDTDIDPASDLTLNFNTDAYQNICGAITAAAQTNIFEVCIYFDSYLFRGNRCVKTDASEFKAFSSPNYPALGQYGLELEIESDHLLPAPPTSVALSNEANKAKVKASARVSYIQSSTQNFPVIQFNAFPAWYDTEETSGLTARLLRACLDLEASDDSTDPSPDPKMNIKGLILESYGAGNFPSGNPDTPENGATYQALQEANAADIIIVDCTQVIQGSVDATVYAAGSWLKDIGALNSTDMTSIAAFTKLMILGIHGGYDDPDTPEDDVWTTQDIKNVFEINLLGEMAESEAPAE